MACAIGGHLAGPRWLRAMVSCQEVWRGSLCISQWGPEGQRSKQLCLSWQQGATSHHWLTPVLFQVYTSHTQRWRWSGHAAPKYGTLAHWIFLAEGVGDTASTGKTFWPSPGAGHETLTWEVPPTPGGKKPDLWRWRDSERKLREGAMRSFPQFTTLTLWHYCTASGLSKLHQLVQKLFLCGFSGGSRVTYIKLIVNKCVSFSLMNVVC